MSVCSPRREESAALAYRADKPKKKSKQSKEPLRRVFRLDIGWQDFPREGSFGGCTTQEGRKGG